MDIPESAKENGSLNIEVKVENEPISATSKQILINKEHKIFLEFIPETGKIRYNLPNTVYFYAKDIHDTPTEFRGKVVEEIKPIRKREGTSTEYTKHTINILQSIESMHFGKGKFHFQPMQGNTYYVKVEYNNGTYENIPIPICTDTQNMQFVISNPIWDALDPLTIRIWSLQKEYIYIYIFLKDVILYTQKVEVGKGVSLQSIMSAKVFKYLPNGGVLSILLANTETDFHQPPPPMNYGYLQNTSAQVRRLESIVGERLIFLKPLCKYNMHLVNSRNIYTVGGDVEFGVKVEGEFPQLNTLNGMYASVKVTDSGVLTQVGKQRSPPMLSTSLLLEGEVLKDNSEGEFYYSADYLHRFFEHDSFDVSPNALGTGSTLYIYIYIYIYILTRLGTGARFAAWNSELAEVHLRRRPASKTTTRGEGQLYRQAHRRSAGRKQQIYIAGPECYILK